MNATVSARVTLWVNRLLALAVAVLVFCMPGLMGWYASVRPLGPKVTDAIIVAYYLCAPVVLYALWTIEKLMGNILADRVFVEDNVRFIRNVCRCCAVVSGICLPVSFFYPPLIFLTVIMFFLALLVNVLKNVMAAAVEIREENDLTV